MTMNVLFLFRILAALIETKISGTAGLRKNKILANARIFLTEAPKELKIRRFVESSLEASKELKTKRFVESLPEGLKEPKIRKFVKYIH